MIYLKIAKHKGVRSLMLLAVALFVMGCRKESAFFEHFIYEFEVRDYRISVMQGWGSDRSLLIRCASDRSFSRRVGARSQGADRALYEKLCIEIGDVAYNRKERLVYGSPETIGWNTYFAAQIKDISIVSDVDWDIDHPAGSSLDNLFAFLSYTPDKYIRQGYKYDREDALEVINKAVQRFGVEATDFWRSSPLTVHFPVAGLLAEIDFSSFRLLGANMSPGELHPLVTPPSGAKVIVSITFEGVGVKTAEYTYP